jgi:hypothetical protein
MLLKDGGQEAIREEEKLIDRPFFATMVLSAATKSRFHVSTLALIQRHDDEGTETSEESTK